MGGHSALLLELAASCAEHVKIFIDYFTIWSSPCNGNTCLCPGFLLRKSLLLPMWYGERTSQHLVRELNLGR